MAADLGRADAPARRVDKRGQSRRGPRRCARQRHAAARRRAQGSGPRSGRRSRERRAAQRLGRGRQAAVIRTVLRLVACAIALAAVIDPAFRSMRPGPLPVTLRASDGRLVPAADAPGSSLRRRLGEAMPGALAINTAAEPAALVVDGAFVDPASIPDRLPVSFVAAPLPAGPRVRVASVDTPRPVLPGWSASVTATIDGRDMPPGASSAIVLEHHGVEVDRTVHR